jgi:hypothetical protein
VRSAQITDEARAIFADALKLQGRYHDCLRTDVCISPLANGRCAECARYIDLSRELDRLLGVKPWERSPLDTDSADPPDYMRNNPWQAALWLKAWERRCEFEAGVP